MAGNNNTMIIGAVVVTVIIIAAALLLTSKTSSTTSSNTTAPYVSTQQPVTTVNNNLTTATVATISATTTVANLTSATAPNLASCDGYNYTLSQPNYQATGSCGWRGGLLNITVFGGDFASATLTIVQQNTTIAPYTTTAEGTTCTAQAGVFSVPRGNYMITFTTGASAGTCGGANVRLSKA